MLRKQNPIHGEAVRTNEWTRQYGVSRGSRGNRRDLLGEKTFRRWVSMGKNDVHARYSEKKGELLLSAE